MFRRAAVRWASRRRRLTAGTDGASLIELLVVLTVGATTAGIAIPATTTSIDGMRVRHAAEYLASRLRLARQQAAAQGAEVALVFDLQDGRWTFRVCVDRNANGVLRTDLQRSKDTCIDGPCDLQALFPGTAVASDSSLPDPDGGKGSSDAIRLGRSNMASFSPAGSASAGSVYLRSAHGVQFAVRVTSATGRVRIIRFDTGTRGWREV